MSAEAIAPQQDAKGRFLPGNSGFGGRPKGSRNKLGEKCIEDLYADWQEHGAAAIVAMREQDVAAYVKVVVSILPKEVKIEHIDDMTDEQLSKRIRQLAADIGIAIGVLEGTGETAGGAEASSQPH